MILSLIIPIFGVFAVMAGLVFLASYGKTKDRLKDGGAIGGLFVLNLVTAIGSAALLSTMSGWLRKADGDLAFLVFLAWFIATLAALWWPWLRYTRG